MKNRLNRLYRRVIRQFRVQELLGFCFVQGCDSSGYTIKFPILTLDESP